MPTLELAPNGPYSLRLSARFESDATRSFSDGVLDLVLHADGKPEQARAWQRSDGVVHLDARTEAGLARLRFILALDDDHSPFLRRFSGDPLLAEPIRRFRGLRPLRTATVAHALLRALAGQLIEARRARSIERRVIAASTPRLGALHVPPTAAQLGAFAPAELVRLGLGARKASTLVRICRSLELEALHAHPTETVARRLLRERGVGPWSVGVVCLSGLGRRERGLARDLGLVKLASQLLGRAAAPEETDALLEPYEEWSGLASVYLLAGHHAGLVG